MADITFADAVDARNLCQDDFLRRTNVVAVGVGYRVKGGVETKEFCVKAYVSTKRPLEALPVALRLPRTVRTSKGREVRVDVDEMEPPVAQSLRQRVRPAEGGYSIGHYRITAGTVAIGVRDVDGGRLFHFLSNNHILANSNASCLGDPILQPAPADGGLLGRDEVAELCRFVPMHFGAGPWNFVDAAVACSRFENVDRRVHFIGEPTAVRNKNGLHVGETLQKTGRTTDYTQGRIVALYTTVNVGYGEGRVARFYDQIVASSMSDGGDSGSLVLDLDGNALGLLFAGSSNSTIINHIQLVEQSLHIKVAERVV